MINGNILAVSSELKKSLTIQHFEGELKNLNIPPKLLEIYLKCLRMLMVGNVRGKCLSMVFSISGFPLNHRYSENTCGIFIIPLFLPQIPKSYNMWENMYFNPIPNLKKIYIWKGQLECYFLYYVLFVSPYGLSMTFVTIPMHFTSTRLLEFVFWTLCFLNSFSKEGCYMEQRYLSYVGVDILDDGLHVPVRVSSLNKGTALCNIY